MAGLRVEVVYAGRLTQGAVLVELAPGTSVGGAIEASGLLARFPEIDLAGQKVGIHGKVTALDALPADGDRIEIYRPLQIDPKEARRLRAGAHR